MLDPGDLLVFGRTGQVARALARLAPGATYLGRAEADLTDPAACAAAIHAHRPAGVINAAAYTAVDAAEDDADTARLVNAAAPGAMAAACAALGVPMVHISTDYVFDGSGSAPWRPGDTTGPLGVYGATKLEGEAAVRASGAVHAILRTSWVFSGDGANFLTTMLRLGAARDSLTVVADQIGGPTPAADIAAACLTIVAALRAQPARSGTYHFSGAPDTSWAGFARAIMAAAALPCTVTDIPSSGYPTRAARPANSRLDCTSLTETFGIARPDWRAGIETVLRSKTP